MLSSHSPAKDSQKTSKTLLSIIVMDYDHNNLAALLDGIFEQETIRSFEILVCDNAEDQETWETGNRYAFEHPGTITLLRNQCAFSAKTNRERLMAMAKGKYYVLLSQRQNFNPKQILQAIDTLEADPLLTHHLVGRISERHTIPQITRAEIHSLADRGQPLVSICVYNYNYGRFLAQCLNSIAGQTYRNIEICFSDNASTDNSWQIAKDFAQHYPGRMSLARNRENFGATANLNNSRRNARGKYLLLLCSDDAMKPDYIERCVTLLEQHPDAAFAMVHREIIDDAGKPTSEPPFYDQTCLIEGEEQAAVYMMAAINPSISQVLYNHEILMRQTVANGVTVRWFGQRLIDFLLCLESSVVYIKDPLLLNRVHGQSDGAAIDVSLIQGIGQYMLALQFAEFAAHHGLTKPAARLGTAIEKVGRLCLRYCATFLLRNDEITALRYLHLAQALFPEIANEESCIALKKYWEGDADARRRILDRLATQAETTRKVSYAPPPGSIPC